jgi:Cupin domain
MARVDGCEPKLPRCRRSRTAPWISNRLSQPCREDETFYVVSGTAEVWIDREIFRCEAGDRVFGPRDVFHNYRNVGILI